MKTIESTDAGEIFQLAKAYAEEKKTDWVSEQFVELLWSSAAGKITFNEPGELSHPDVFKVSQVIKFKDYVPWSLMQIDDFLLRVSIESIQRGNISQLQELDSFKIAAYILKAVGVTSSIEHPFGDKVAIWNRQDFDTPVEYFIGSKFTDGMNAEQKGAFYFSDEWKRFSKSVALHLELIIGDFIIKCSEK